MMLTILVGLTAIQAQETEPAGYDIKSPFHNQLFFNRFLINPTFSLVRENKSYLNILLRNQYASYEDNNQNYYLGFSNKLDKNTALGLGVYGHWSGVIQEFGFNANYATGVPLGEKSALTFGANINYHSEGLDKSRIIASANDPLLETSQKQNKVSFQPGLNLTLGRFDIGVSFEDLVQYNQTTSELVTNFNAQNINPTLQYTHTMKNTNGLFKDARVMPLLQLGVNEEGTFKYSGAFLMDVPKFGWLQAAYDEDYGLSSGIGFNLSKKLSLGYVMEKNLNSKGDNLGTNHEIALGYTFNDELRGMGINVNIASAEDARVDEVVRNYEEQIVHLKQQLNKKAQRRAKFDEEALGQYVSIAEDKKEDDISLAYENRLILDELILRQDSIEKARTEMFERRFETMVRLIRHEMKQERPQSRQQNRSLAKYQTGVAENNNTSEKQVEKKREFNEIPIKALNRSDIVGVESGFYLIVNVFSNTNYLKTFMQNLDQKGLDARQFYNKENGLYYVYLADFKSKQDADTAIVSNLNGAYQEDKWIMQVQGSTYATADIDFDME